MSDYYCEERKNKPHDWYVTEAGKYRCLYCGNYDETRLFDPEEGQRRKEAGMGAAEDKAKEEWKQAFRDQTEYFARMGWTFTSEDIIKEIGLPTGKIGLHKNNGVGAMMNAMARRGIIRKTGHHVPSQRPGSHGAELTEWVGA